jgi:tyrosyl-tRNA synthetase
MVQLKNAPAEVPELEVPSRLLGSTWVDLCFSLNLSKSKSEIRRLIKQAGFYIEQQPMKDIEARAEIPTGGVTVLLGKRRYFRLVRGI